MGQAFCIGGWTADDRSVRLLLPGANCHPLDTPFRIGDVWELDFAPREDVVPPHVEDVIVTRGRRAGRIANVGDVLRRRVPVWSGEPHRLYDGVLGWTANGSGYVSHRRGLPRVSTGFWLPDRDLHLAAVGDDRHYHYPQRYSRRLGYVGAQRAEEVIPAGTLVRVSLARWWAPVDSGMEERCYLQLSGWYA